MRMDKQAYYCPYQCLAKIIPEYFRSCSEIHFCNNSVLCFTKRLFLITKYDLFHAVLFNDEVLFRGFDNLILIHISIFSIEMSNRVESIYSVSL